MLKNFTSSFRLASLVSLFLCVALIGFMPPTVHVQIRHDAVTHSVAPILRYVGNVIGITMVTPEPAVAPQVAVSRESTTVTDVRAWMHATFRISYEQSQANAQLPTSSQSQLTDTNMLTTGTPSTAMGRWFRNPVVNQVIYQQIGDSRTDERGPGSTYWSALYSYVYPGGPLENVVFQDMGNSGLTGYAFLTGSGTNTSLAISAVSGTVNPTLTVASGTTFESGVLWTISGVQSGGVSSAINGTWPIVAVDSTHMQLIGAVGTGTYTTTSATANLNSTITGLNPAATLTSINFGTNDVRQGNSTYGTVTALTSTIVSIIDKVRGTCPNSAILLLVPYAFASNDYGSNGYVVPNTSAQTYVNIMRQSYYNAWAKRPMCALFDEQDEIFGRDCRIVPPTGYNAQVINAEFADQLHLNSNGTARLAEAIAALLNRQGDQTAYSTQARGLTTCGAVAALGRSGATAAAARSPWRAEAASFEQFSYPELTDPACVLDPALYQVYGVGTVVSTAGSAIAINGLAGQPNFGYMAPEIAPYDVLFIPGYGAMLANKSFAGWGNTGSYLSVSGAGGSFGYTVTGATNTTPVTLTVSGFPAPASLNNKMVTVSGCLGNTGANGTYLATVTGTNTLTLYGSVGNGTWTSGGTITYLPTIGATAYLARHIYQRDRSAQAVMLDPLDWPYAHRGYIANYDPSDTWYDIAAYPGDIPANRWNVTTSDFLIVTGVAARQLTGFTISGDGPYLRVTKTGAGFLGAAVVNWPVLLYGTHAMETTPLVGSSIPASTYGTSITASYTVPAGIPVTTVSVNASSGNVTVTLPDALISAGNRVRVIRTDSSGNTVTIALSPTPTYTVTAASNTTPIVLTLSAPCYLPAGSTVTVTGVGGNTNANTTTTVTIGFPIGYASGSGGAFSPTHITLVGTTGNAAYTSGGTVTPATSTQTIYYSSGSASTLTLGSQGAAYDFSSDGANWTAK